MAEKSFRSILGNFNSYCFSKIQISQQSCYKPTSMVALLFGSTLIILGSNLEHGKVWGKHCRVGKFAFPSEKYDKSKV